MFCLCVVVVVVEISQDKAYRTTEERNRDFGNYMQVFLFFNFFLNCCCSVSQQSTLRFTKAMHVYIDKCIPPGERMASVPVIVCLVAQFSSAN